MVTFFQSLAMAGAAKLDSASAPVSRIVCIFIDISSELHMACGHNSDLSSVCPLPGSPKLARHRIGQIGAYERVLRHAREKISANSAYLSRHNDKQIRQRGYSPGAPAGGCRFQGGIGRLLYVFRAGFGGKSPLLSVRSR